MQVSELLGLDVSDADDQPVGTIIDVRLALGGDLDHDPDPPTLFGLLVSPHSRSSYLGYERSDARRPKVLAALLRWRHRGTFLALWDDVQRIDTTSVLLRSNFTRYSPTLRHDD